MNAFDLGKSVESRAEAVLLPFLEERGHRRYVLTAKGRLARYLQETVGDLLFNDEAGRIWSVEFKSEERYTGNLFLEFWSNRNFGDKASYFERGPTMGWLVTLRADLLFYYFLDKDVLYIIDLLELKRWAFGHGSNPSHIFDPRYKEVRQSKYDQLNETVGRIVPVADLSAAMKVRVLYPKQIPLFPEAA